MKKIDQLSRDQLSELTVEYRRYRRACVKMGSRPLSLSAWADKKIEAVVEPVVEELPVKKTKAKKEERQVILDDIFELTPEQPPETDSDLDSSYFK